MCPHFEEIINLPLYDEEIICDLSVLFALVAAEENFECKSVPKLGNCFNSKNNINELDCSGLIKFRVWSNRPLVPNLHDKLVKQCFCVRLILDKNDS